MSKVLIPSADLKAFADAAMELVDLKVKQGNKNARQEHEALIGLCSEAYSNIRSSTDIFGVYRCTKCGTDWRTTSMGQALTCPHCRKQDVEPVYASGVNDVDHEAVVNALANHERAFPAKTQKGEYFIEVQRTGYACSTVRVNSCGPASAMRAAIDRAPDIDFRSETSSSYEAMGVTTFTPDVAGETFLWEDSLSSEVPPEVVTVKEVLSDEVVLCEKKDGEVTELPLSELKPL
jgi:predicted Zn-ribbon and HTH transcriptional regulator